MVANISTLLFGAESVKVNWLQKVVRYFDVYKVKHPTLFKSL